MGLTKETSLVGHHVKKSFATDKEHHPKFTSEAMWVMVTKQEGDRLTGILDNDPVFCSGLEVGDEVVFGLEEVVDVFSDGDA